MTSNCDDDDLNKKSLLGDVKVENEQEKTNGYKDAWFLSKMFWTFAYGLVKRGYHSQEGLKLNDIHPPSDKDRAEVHINKLKTAWNDEVSQAREFNLNKSEDEEYKTPSFLKAVLRTYFLSYLLAGFPQYINAGCKIGAVLCLQAMLKWLNDPLDDDYKGYLWTVGIAGLTLIGVTAHQQYYFYVSRVGVRCKMAASGMMYNHALGFSSNSLAKIDMGFAANVLCNDPFRFEDLSAYLYFLWESPCETAVVMWLIYREINYTMFFIIGIFVILVSFQWYFSGQFARIRASLVKYTDARVKAVNEVLMGFELVKMYRWESAVTQRIVDARAQEMVYINQNANIKGFNLGFYLAAHTLITSITFVIHSARGYTLDADSVFAVIGYLAIVTFPFTQHVPNSVEKCAEVYVACQRMQSMLLVGVDYGAPLPEEASSSDGDGDGDGDGVESESSHNEDVSVHNASSLNTHATHTTTGTTSTTSTTGTMGTKDASEKQTSSLDISSLPPGSIYINNTTFAWPKYSSDHSPLDDDDTHTHTDLYSRSNMDSFIGHPDDESESDSEEDIDHSLNGLKNINIHITPGELIGVIGSIGTYKSSLIQAMIGEMPYEAQPGQRLDVKADSKDYSPFIRGTCSYAPQRPFLLPITVRDNITFGDSLDEERYINTLYSCGLGRDIEIFAQADETMVGERGAGLSGGQKARLGLSRAVYNQSDVYIFDDPLSALDAVVAQHVFMSAISNNGMLSGKTRVLVTHNESVLQHCDRIIVMGKRGVTHFDTYSALLSRGIIKIEEKHHAAYSTSTSSTSTITPHDSDSQLTQEFSENLLTTDTHDDSHQKQSDNDEASDLTVVNTDSTIANYDVNEDVVISGVTPDSIRNYLAQPRPPSISIMSKAAQVRGSIPISVYKQFFVSDRYFTTLILLIIFVSPSALKIASDTWLTYWIDKSYVNQQDHHWRNVMIWLVSFSSTLGIARAVFAIRHIIGCIDVAQMGMTKGVVYTSASFIHSNQTGEILSRFSKDLEVLVAFLSATMFDYCQVIIIVLSVIVVVGLTLPWMLLIFLIIIPLFVVIRQFYIPSARDAKRLEASTRAQYLAIFTSTLSGLAVIRVFNTQAAFYKLFVELLNNNIRTFFGFQYTSRWMGSRLDAICVTLIFACGCFACGMKSSMEPSSVGFVLSNIMSVSSLLTWMVRQSAEVESLMISAERVMQYVSLPREGTLYGVQRLPLSTDNSGLPNSLSSPIKPIDKHSLDEPSDKSNDPQNTQFCELTDSDSKPQPEDGDKYIVPIPNDPNDQTGFPIQPVLFRNMYSKTNIESSSSDDLEHGVINSHTPYDTSRQQYILSQTHIQSLLQQHQAEALKAVTDLTAIIGVLKHEIQEEDKAKMFTKFNKNKPISERVPIPKYKDIDISHLNLSVPDDIAVLALADYKKRARKRLRKLQKSGSVASASNDVSLSEDEDVEEVEDAEVEDGSNVSDKNVNSESNNTISVTSEVNSDGVELTSISIQSPTSRDQFSPSSSAFGDSLSTSDIHSKLSNRFKLDVCVRALYGQQPNCLLSPSKLDYETFCQHHGFTPSSDLSHLDINSRNIDSTGSSLVEYKDEDPVIFSPPSNWPQHGEVKFESVVMSYQPGLPVILKGFTLNIKPGSSVALVGRTGCGKSTSLTVMFRLISKLLYGRVLIDGIDINTIGLHEARSALCIIPQTPIIFSGTLRYNLDPFSVYKDRELIEVINKVHLSQFFSALPFGLATIMSEATISVGELQLISIARAFLMVNNNNHGKKTILLLDEITANCDRETDIIIQDVIRKCFGDRTRITIAHRLETIIDADNIVVMDAGQIIEQGNASELLSIDGGVFSQMYHAQKHEN